MKHVALCTNQWNEYAKQVKEHANLAAQYVIRFVRYAHDSAKPVNHVTVSTKQVNKYQNKVDKYVKHVITYDN